MIITVKQGFRFDCQMEILFQVLFLQVFNFLVAFDNINCKTCVLQSAISRKVEVTPVSLQCYQHLSSVIKYGLTTSSH